MEDFIGENPLRITLVCSTIICGLMTCIFGIYSGNILTGISFNLLTGNQIPAGKISEMSKMSKMSKMCAIGE